MNFDDSWFFMQGADCVVQRIWHSDTIIIYLANSSWLKMIYVNLMHQRLVLRDQTHAGQLLRLTSPSFVVDQSLKMCNYKWPASFFIQSVSMSLSFKLPVSPSPPELMWVRVLMQRDAWLTTAVWLSRPDETASSPALHAWCTSIPQNNSQTRFCSLTWPLVPLNRH